MIGIASTYIINYTFLKLQKSFIDNVFRNKVEPMRGSVVYCNLGLPGMPSVEHTGIYVGNSYIVHLNGKGEIELVDSAEFLNRLDGFNAAISIYVSTYNEPFEEVIAVGSDIVADRALSQLYRTVKYNLLTDNCNNFTAGCLTGDFDNMNSLLINVATCARKVLGANGWRVGIFDDA